MADKSGIEWTEATWNPVLGCSKTSPGCDNCYAIAQSQRNTAMGSKAYQPALTVKAEGALDWTGELRVLPERLDQPLRWQKPRKVFVNSMSDLFHQEVSDGFIGDVWNVMALAPQHQFQILTKRSKRMRDVMIDWQTKRFQFRKPDMVWVRPLHEPLSNVWLGVSVESDKYKFRVRHLQETPAAVRWLSIEPLVGPLTLYPQDLEGIDWVVVGGESGSGSRPMHPDWVRGLRDACVAAGVPFFFKQWGNWGHTGPDDDKAVAVSTAGVIYDEEPRVGDDAWMRRFPRKKDAGRELDGQEWSEYPNEV